MIVMLGQPVEIELLFDRTTSAWAKDRQWHPSQRVIKNKQDCLTMTLKVADTPELLGWILSFGSGVKVLRPESLRERIKEVARKILELAG